MKKEQLHIDIFESKLLDELNEMQDYILCPMDILDTVRAFIDEYIEQEVSKRLDELDDTINDIKL
jgi:hypothetical protein|tara:strand:+ start:1558 stop:1752 length:195 start_codon:yes stop_codon:yes gene_type:complete